ncbi:UNVERIFIED_CONTAM: hypothetical protein PYX00_011938 [Menopon gallinae]|uniref:beta-N-acetylhexosaminidase n=1 Tax=Menopon gallinae TaxID=328185 RepID=A0AAW2H920_9NEOP
MNFAPTVDLYTNYQNLVIGPRSFSADPKKVAMFALAYYKGLKEAGVIATAKHFPGHGEASEDSHGVLPQVNLSYEQLKIREFIPYRLLIEEGIPAIMGGHLLFPRICSQTSSLSKVFLKDILRGKLGFKQIILTDDLIMAGASVSGLTPEEIAEKAIRAGNTLLLASMDFKTLETIRQHFLMLMNQDVEFKSMVEESVACNLQVKLDYLHETLQEDTLSVEQRLNSLPLEQTKQILQQIAMRSVTKFKLDEKSFLSPHKKTLLVSTYPDFLSEGKKFFPNSQGYRYAYLPLQTPNAQTKLDLETLASSYEQIIFNLTTPASLSYLLSLKPWNKKLTVVCSLSPVLLAKATWLERCLIVYGINSPSYRAGFWALLGKYQPLVAVILAEGFEETEAVVPSDILRRATITTHLLALEELLVLGSRNITLKADALLRDKMNENYEAVLLPGGLKGAKNLAQSSLVKDFIQKIINKGGLVCAICASPALVLAQQGFLEKAKYTGYPDPTLPYKKAGVYLKDRAMVLDKGFLTAKGLAYSLDFGLAIVSFLDSPIKAFKVAKDICYEDWDLSKEDQQGNIDAYFQPIKVIAKTESPYFYQVKLQHLTKLYENSSSLEFSVFIRSKISLKEKRARFSLPFVKSLKREDAGKVQFLGEDDLSPTLVRIKFSVPLEDVEEAIKGGKNFIFNVNRGEMYWLISYKQLSDLHKALIKKGYLIEGL